VQAVRSFFPQLDSLRKDPVTAPSRRAGWPHFVRESFGEVGHPLFEHISTCDHLALMACDSTSTSSQRPRPPVGIRLRVVDLLHCPTNPDLSMHWEEPMKECRGEWIRSQLSTLVAFPIGVKDETSVVDPPEKNHPGGGASIGVGRGKCHRFRHGLACSPRNVEPPG
jgi:hypothetical protein